MTQHVRREPWPTSGAAPWRSACRPGRDAGRCRQPGSSDRPVWSLALAGQHRRVRVRPVTCELVSDLGQPPIDQRVGAVDRRHESGLRAAAAAALPVADVQLAQFAEVRAPVADVEHHRLVDPQSEPTPQRRGEVVPGGRQVLARLRHRGAPAGEQLLDLRVGRRHPHLPQRRALLAVELVDRLLDHDAAQGVDVALIAADHELVEQRQHPRLPGTRGHRVTRPSLPGQEPVGVLATRRPQRPVQRAGGRTRRSPSGCARHARRSTPRQPSRARTDRRSPARNPRRPPWSNT